MYLKLGKLASCFYCMKSKLFISSQKQAVEYTGEPTKRISAGIKGGALVEIQEEEYQKMKAAWDEANPPVTSEATATPGKSKKPKEEEVEVLSEEKKELKARLEAMSADGLLEYYQENYNVDEGDVKTFNKLKSNAKKVAFLLED